MKSTFTFGFIGTFGYWHGIEVLEKIIPALVRQNSAIRFLLIGDGVLKKDLECALRQHNVLDSVVMTGQIAQEKAPEYLAQCDAFLCPTQPNVDGSRFFGSPTKLFEYMSMAKPIIASDLEQLSEVLSPSVRISDIRLDHVIQITDQVGMLVDPLDMQGFIDACLWCVSLSSEQRILLGNNARRKVIEHYTWQQHVKKIIKHANL